jgi:Tol biopolymer transport system component
LTVPVLVVRTVDWAIWKAMAERGRRTAKHCLLQGERHILANSDASGPAVDCNGNASYLRWSPDGSILRFKSDP